MIINILRNLQVNIGEKFKKIVSTNKASVIVILNAAYIASYQVNCIDTIIDLRSILFLLFNSFFLISMIDVRILKFFKILLAGAIGYMTTSEAISLYLRYFGSMGKRCKLPLYVDGYFNLSIILVCFSMVLYWIFTGNNHINPKIKIDNDF